MEKSKHLEKFKRLAESCPDAYTLIGDFLLVEAIKEEEFRTRGGIILPTLYDNTKQLNTLVGDRPRWVRVLLTGPGYYSQETDENGNIVEKTTPLETKPGDIILVAQASMKWFSMFGELNSYEKDSIGLTKESEIQLRFNGDEGFSRAFHCLNQPSAEEVAAGQQ